eukprot:15471017-Alexandrium_andersonii.AAC.1
MEQWLESVREGETLVQMKLETALSEKKRDLHPRDMTLLAVFLATAEGVMPLACSTQAMEQKVNEE